MAIDSRHVEKKLWDRHRNRSFDWHSNVHALRDYTWRVSFNTVK
jgi:hypothetical protein